MQLRTGLNPYGLTYYLGLQGRGTPRANPIGGRPRGLYRADRGSRRQGHRAARTAGSRNWMTTGLAALRARLEKSDIVPVISSGLQHGDVDACIRYAQALGATVHALRADPDPPRRARGGRPAVARSRQVDATRSSRRQRRRLRRPSVTLLIENHQDFTSRELVAFCEEYGPSVRIVYDTANSFPVAEAPLDFTRVVAPYVRYCHAKDYQRAVHRRRHPARPLPDGRRRGAVQGAVRDPRRAQRDDARRDRDRRARGASRQAADARVVAGLCAEAGRGACRLPPRGAAQPPRATMPSGARPGSATPTTSWSTTSSARCRRSVANMKSLGLM